jgi:predicted MPP superfamily phosphohydrolase
MYAALVFIGFVLIYLFFIFPTQWLKVEFVEQRIGLGKRILQISDLHVDKLRISVAQLRKVIERTKPDYVMLTGDYTHEERYLPKLERYVQMIAESGIPVYAVLGNHDYDLPNLRLLLDMFAKYRIRVLRNESTVVDDWKLVGIDNASTGHSRPEASFAGIDEAGAGPTLVITHDPNVVLDIRRSYDYLMAGHLHGKQLNVPYFFKIKRKGPLADQGIYKGLHHMANGVCYISKGVGQAGFNARFMVRSEVTVHDL